MMWCEDCSLMGATVSQSEHGHGDMLGDPFQEQALLFVGSALTHSSAENHVGK